MNFDLETQILAAFIQDRGAYDQVQAVVAGTDFSEVGRILFQAIETYYAKDPAAGFVDKDVLAQKLRRKYRQQAEPLLDSLAGLPTSVSTANTLEEVLEQRKVIVESRLGNALMNPGRRHEEIQGHIDDWMAVGDIKDKLLKGETDLSDEIYQPTASMFAETPMELMPLFPGKLNDVTGGIVKGMNMVVFGRSEIGKSGFAINLSCGWLKKGYRVCYVANEEDIRILFLRHLCRLVEHGISLEDMLTGSPSFTSALEKAHDELGRLLIKRLNPGTERELLKLIDQFKPDAMIIDQMLIMQPKTQEGLATTSAMLRRLGGKTGVTMVPLTQADEASVGRTRLGQHNIYMSKTAVQGDADILVGLGADEGYIAMNKLHINVVKDKVPGGGHDNFPVTIDRSIGKLISLKS